MAGMTLLHDADTNVLPQCKWICSMAFAINSNRDANAAGHAEGYGDCHVMELSLYLYSPIRCRSSIHSCDLSAILHVGR